MLKDKTSFFFNVQVRKVIMFGNIIKQCKICGKEFLSWRYKKRKYCSRKCSGISRRSNGNPGYRPAEERFWEKVDKTPGHGPSGDCWIWTGFVHKSGYGYFYFLKKRWEVHRFSYVLHFGDIPSGMCICHNCDNRRCVNPDHLSVGTHRDNTKDKINKGRAYYLRGEESPGALLTEQEVMAIRESGKKQIEIAKEYGVTQAAISLIRCRKTWQHLL